MFYLYIGYPIANDPLYNTTTTTTASSSTTVASTIALPTCSNRDITINKKLQETISKAGIINNNNNNDNDVNNNNNNNKNYTETCPDCHINWEAVDPTKEELCMYLHSWKYSSTGENNWNFESPLPNWAKDVNIIK